MASINKVILIGNLGADPEIRYVPDGTPVATFSMATSDSWRDSNGVKQERTEWHRIVLRRSLAELAGKYLRKGTALYLEGRLRTRKWQDRNGADHFTTEIVGLDLQMLGKKDTDAPHGKSMPVEAGSSGEVGEGAQSGAALSDDDLPW